MTVLTRYRAELSAYPDPDLELVMELAATYEASGVPMEELIAEGNVGLAEALRLLDEGLLEGPFAMESATRIRAHIEKAISLHNKTRTLHGALEYNQALVADIADGLSHGILQDRYDDAYELWLGFKGTLEVRSLRQYEMCLSYFGIGEPFPKGCEDIGDCFNLGAGRTKMIVNDAVERLGKMMRGYKVRPAPESVSLLLDKYYRDPDIFKRRTVAASRKWNKTKKSLEALNLLAGKTHYISLKDLKAKQGFAEAEANVKSRTQPKKGVMPYVKWFIRKLSR